MQNKLFWHDIVLHFSLKLYQLLLKINFPIEKMKEFGRFYFQKLTIALCQLRYLMDQID